MKPTVSFLVCALLAACLSLVNAHGTVDRIRCDNRTYPAPLPGRGTKMASPVRQIRTLEPIPNAYSNDMKCGPGAAESAELIADVTAGSKVAYGWTAGGMYNWPHRYGCVMLYAYKCPNDNAKTCRPPNDAQWILIDSACFDPNPNQVPAGSNPARTGWVQDRFRANMTVSANVPKNLPNGHYLFRHEITALHVAMSRGPEWYVSCAQVRVKGGSNRSLRSQGAQFVKFPGAYSPSHPGLRVNVFDNGLNAKTYKRPGPALFVGTNRPEPEAPAPSSSSSSGAAPSKTDSPSPGKTTSGKRCKARRDERGELIKRSEGIEVQKRGARHARSFKRDLVQGHKLS